MVASRLAVGVWRELRVVPLLGALSAIALPFAWQRVAFSVDVAVFVLSAAFALLAVHALDTYEDEFVRGEDEYKTFTFAHGASGLLSATEVLVLAALASLAFIVLTVGLALRAGVAFVPFSLAAFVVGVGYSGVWSRFWAFALVADVAGIVLAMAAAFTLAGGTDWAFFARSALPVGLVLVGWKCVMESADAPIDLRSGRSNASNLFGIQNVMRGGLALTLLALTLLALPLVFSSRMDAARGAGALVAGMASTWGFSRPPAQGVWGVSVGVMGVILLAAWV